MNVPASITPYSSRRTSIFDANNRHIAYTLGSNEQSEATAALMADCVNFVTEAESLAQTDVRVAAAYKELREAVEATRAEFSESEAAA
jgi:GTP cyclohydrolase I